MTIVADFSVPRARLWEAYADPRQIEKFWGPPGWPATFLRHDLYPGGRSEYFMIGPQDERSHGYWEFTSVEPGHSFEVLDGFATEDGHPRDEMPSMRMKLKFADTETGSQLVTTTYFNSLTELEQLIEMGMEEGTRAAMSQIDDVAADLGVDTQILSDTKVRFSRVLRGPVEQIWTAHHDPHLLKRWLLGPEGWELTECQLADTVGGSYRFTWVKTDAETGFSITGELLESDPPHREVTTEALEDMPGPPAHNVQTLSPVQSETLLTLVITYATRDLRDAALETGMTEGMEISYARLDKELAAV